MNSLKKKLIELELHCLKPEVRSSKMELDRLLADDFIEILSSGKSYNKSHALNPIPNQVSPVFSQQDYELRMLSNQLAQLLYKATVQKPGDQTISYSQRSSIWQLKGEQWQLLFPQGTLCEEFEIGIK